MIREPGILGGAPAFAAPVPWVCPTLPALAEIAGPLDDALRRGQLTNDGPNVRRFEERLGEYLGARCVCVANGTLALYLATACLGGRPRALLPSFTFPATGLALAMRGAELVLADVAAGTWCLDVAALEPAAAIAPSAPSAPIASIDVVVPVNVYGQPPDAGRLDAFSRDTGCPVIYDSAHGLGSEHRGRKVGGFGTAEVFSLHATKILGCGEGGFVATRDEALAREVASRRNFGLEEQRSRSLGTNAKMQEFSAILGLWGLPRLEGWIERRTRLAACYRARLCGMPGLRLQEVDPRDRSNRVNFPVLIDEEFGLTRDDVVRALAADNIGARAYFSPDLAAHPGLAASIAPVPSSAPDGEPPPRAREISRKVLCLPIYSHQEEEEVNRICESLARIYDARARVARELGGAHGEAR